MEFPDWAPKTLVNDYIFCMESSKCEKCGEVLCSTCDGCKNCNECRGVCQENNDKSLEKSWDCAEPLYRLFTNPDMERAWKEVEKKRLQNEIYQHDEDKFYQELFRKISWSMNQTKKSVNEDGCITLEGEEEDGYRAVRDLCSKLAEAIKITKLDVPPTCFYFEKDIIHIIKKIVKSDADAGCLWSIDPKNERIYRIFRYQDESGETKEFVDSHFDSAGDWLNHQVLNGKGTKLSDVLTEVRHEAICELEKIKHRKSVIERKTKKLTFFIRTFFSDWKVLVGGIMPGTLAAFCRAIFDDAYIDKGTIEAALKNYHPD